MRDDSKFFKNLMKKIETCQNYYKQIKLETDKIKKENLIKETEMEHQEISALILGKMNAIWNKIEKMPDGEEKNYKLFQYNALVDDIENICGM
jgi:hypothetical protein